MNISENEHFGHGINTKINTFFYLILHAKSDNAILIFLVQNISISTMKKKCTIVTLGK